MSAGLEFVNLPEVIAGFTAAGKRFEATAVWALGQTSAALYSQIYKNLGTYTNSAAPTGRRYKSHEGPSSFPDLVTGTLQKSVQSTFRREGLGTYVAEVGPGAPYARKIELGGEGSKAYPYMRPAIKTVDPERLFVRKFKSKWKG